MDAKAKIILPLASVEGQPSDRLHRQGGKAMTGTRYSPLQVRGASEPTKHDLDLHEPVVRPTRLRE